MSVSISIAIWAIVAIFAVIAFFLGKFLNQLTRIGVEGESALKTLNSKLPALFERAEVLMNKADSTIDRVNATMDQLEAPIGYIQLAGRLFSDFNLSAKIGKAAMALFSGFKTGKAMFANMRGHFSCKKHEDAVSED